MKKSYVIVKINIENIDIFQEYPKLSTECVNRFGGKYLVRGGSFNVMEGKWPFERTTIIEFDSLEKAHKWYNSKDYSKAKQIRNKSSTSDLIIIEGY